MWHFANATVSHHISAPIINNGGLREASNTALSVHQKTGSSADATIQTETIQGQSTALAKTFQEDRNMVHENHSLQPSFHDAEQVVDITIGDPDLDALLSSFMMDYESTHVITNGKNDV